MPDIITDLILYQTALIVQRWKEVEEKSCFVECEKESILDKLQVDSMPCLKSVSKVDMKNKGGIFRQCSYIVYPS